MDFWKRIRILVADGCNYHCPFCHNEGQKKSLDHRIMSMALFMRVIDAISDKELDDICISGGEPFLNRHVVDMLLYACEKTKSDISCASNLSLITDEQIARLAHSRVKFNIQFPFADERLFKRSTGRDNFSRVVDRVERLLEAGVRIGLNTVVQVDTIENIEGILAYAGKRSIPLKLLPEIGREESRMCRERLEMCLSERILERQTKGTGAIRWVVDVGGKPVNVLFIDSPCLSGEFAQCRHYGEVRVWPGGLLQPCIHKRPTGFICEGESLDEILRKLASLWKDFKSC